MTQPIQERPPVGSILSIHDGSGQFHLGVVCNREAGLRWLRRDPVKGFMPGEDEMERFVLVRYLGDHIGYPFERSMVVGLSDEEPDRALKQRFGYAQTNQCPVLARNGVEVHHLRSILNTALNLFGGNTRGMLDDLELVSKHSNGATAELAGNDYYRSYFRMLDELLPRDSETRTVIPEGA